MPCTKKKKKKKIYSLLCLDANVVQEKNEISAKHGKYLTYILIYEGL